MLKSLLILHITGYGKKQEQCITDVKITTCPALKLLGWLDKWNIHVQSGLKMLVHVYNLAGYCFLANPNFLTLSPCL